jgi:PhzF family phenazine biosynthesis protein
MLRFDIVDVFSSDVGDGNPVAIVHDAGGLNDLQMQKIASWIGLPETAYVMDPESPRSDYALRIFAPTCELPFAGHPSIGALAAQLSRKPAWEGRSEFVQECKGGLVSISLAEINGEAVISVQTPVGAEVEPLGPDVTDALIMCLAVKTSSAKCYRTSAGAKWIIISFEDDFTVLDAVPDPQTILELSIEHDVSGVTIFAPTTTHDAEYVVRSFAPRIGVMEDAACGGGNACVAAAVAHSSGDRVQYIATQGQKLGRNAKIFAAGPFLDNRFRIGGHTRIVVSGELNLA